MLHHVSSMQQKIIVTALLSRNYDLTASGGVIETNRNNNKQTNRSKDGD